MSMDIAAYFGDNLARVRRGADLSQDELSVRSSLHRTEISQIERGLRIPRIDTLVKLAGSLEVKSSPVLADQGDGLRPSRDCIEALGQTEPDHRADRVPRPTSPAGRFQVSNQPLDLGRIEEFCQPGAGRMPC